jgi:endonuclease/exonuclease/phosphatase family metal-dependent hydrolase
MTARRKQLKPFQSSRCHAELVIRTNAVLQAFLGLFLVLTLVCNKKTDALSVSVRSPTIKPSSKVSKQFSLVSWNILAPDYASPKKYPWVAGKYLEWSHREPLIVKELLTLDTDIIFLQEVQVDLWPSLFEQLQGSYDIGELQKTGNDHPVANAILVHKKFPAKVVRTESRSRALFAVLQWDEEDEDNEDDNGVEIIGASTSSSADADDDRAQSHLPPLYLANVHWLSGGGAQKDDTRFYQIRSLLKRIELQIARDREPPSTADDEVTGDSNSTTLQVDDHGEHKGDNHNNSTTLPEVDYEEDPPALILAGDWNMFRTNPLYNLLATGTIPKRKRGTFSPDVAEKAIATYSNALLPFKEAWRRLSPSPTGRAAVSTHASGSFLDYIWTSKRVEVVATFSTESVERGNLWEPEIFMVPVVRSNTKGGISGGGGGVRRVTKTKMPSKTHPSDHLPVGAFFRVSLK